MPMGFYLNIYLITYHLCFEQKLIIIKKKIFKANKTIITHVKNLYLFHKHVCILMFFIFREIPVFSLKI